MKLTPLDIRQQQFKKTRGRYDAGEVDSFLQMASMELEASVRECADLKEDLKRTKVRLGELAENEKILRDAIIATQKAAQDLLAGARKERDIIIAEARLDAEKLTSNAHEQVRKLAEDVAEMRRQRARVEAELGAILHAHLKMLEATSGDAKRHDADADKVAILGKK